MYKINDVILYSTHGICRIDDIVEKHVGDEQKQYYVMHPLQDPKLTITIPVIPNQSKFIALMTKEEAIVTLQAFQTNYDFVVDKNFYRSDAYSQIIQTGDRLTMVKVIQSILLQKAQCISENKKLPIAYTKVLDFLQKQLYTEIGYALNEETTDVEQKVHHHIFKNLQHA